MFATVWVFCDLKHTKTRPDFEFLRLNQTWARLYYHKGSDLNNSIVWTPDSGVFRSRARLILGKFIRANFMSIYSIFAQKPKIFYDHNSRFEMIFLNWRLYLRVVQTEVDITFEINVGKKRIRHSTNFEILCLRLPSGLPLTQFG